MRKHELSAIFGGGKRKEMREQRKREVVQKEWTVVIRVVHQGEISTNKAKFEYKREKQKNKIDGSKLEGNKDRRT